MHQMCPGLGHGIGWLGEGWGGGAAMFWPIVSRACTNCWTGLIALVDGCTETGGDCCRVGGVHELHDGGGCEDGISAWPSKSSVTGSPSSRVSVMTGSPGDGKALRGWQTWAQPLGWPLSHRVCWVVSEMVRGYHS